MSNKSISDSETDSTVTPLYARLHKTLDNNMGDIVLPIVINALASALEEDVKAWLKESAVSDRIGD